jgi:hypothetical protein
VASGWGAEMVVTMALSLIGTCPRRISLKTMFWSTDTGHLQLRQLVFDRRQVAIGGV